MDGHRIDKLRLQRRRLNREYNMEESPARYDNRLTKPADFPFNQANNQNFLMSLLHPHHRHTHTTSRPGFQYGKKNYDHALLMRQKICLMARKMPFLAWFWNIIVTKNTPTFAVDGKKCLGFSGGINTPGSLAVSFVPSMTGEANYCIFLFGASSYYGNGFFKKGLLYGDKLGQVKYILPVASTNPSTVK
jgi:hypothetical protein